jgi:hypothetical protein
MQIECPNKNNRGDPMNKLRVKWGLVLKALLIVLPLIGVKIVFHYLGWEFMEIGTLTSALVSGVFFVIAIILAGVLTDFKECERILGEFASSIENIYRDSKLIGTESEVSDLLSHLRDLVHNALLNFKRRNSYRMSDISPILDMIEVDILSFNKQGKPISIITRMRSDLANIKRISYRVETIKETTFLTAAHAIAETGVAAIVLVLLLSKIEPYYTGLLFMGVLSLILTSVILIIKDMDNPFEGNATVDLGTFYKLEKYLDSE